MSYKLHENKDIRKFECLALVYLNCKINTNNDQKLSLKDFIKKDDLLPEFQIYYDLTLKDDLYIEILKELNINGKSR